MHQSSTIAAVIAISGAIIAHASPLATVPTLSKRAGSCTAPSVRQEWSSAPLSVRQEYISAALCLATKPSKLGLNNATLYDDFAYVHNLFNNQVHFVAQFLPWHRQYVHTYEQSLKDCGYTGSMLYWDWTVDSQNPSAAAIWDATTGVGGNGNRSIPDGQSRCLTDGPFKGLTPLFTDNTRNRHCLSRSFNDGSDQVGQMLGQFYSPSAVAAIMPAPDYNTFRTQLESGPHGAIHSGIGGDMSPSTSPNDPIFFIHHTQIDRLWWLWQQQHPDVAGTYSGNLNQKATPTSISPAAQLTDIMGFAGLTDPIPVSDVMSTETDLLCYRY